VNFVFVFAGENLEQKFNKIAAKAISRVEIITAFITNYASTSFESDKMHNFRT
jgi:hypothetical protein